MNWPKLWNDFKDYYWNAGVITLAFMYITDDLFSDIKLRPLMRLLGISIAGLMVALYKQRK